jgi:hypothetical protein
MVWLGIAVALSCGSKPEDALIGRWLEVDGTEVMEFFADGKVTVEDEGDRMAGTYQIAEEGQISLELSGVGVFAAPILTKGSLDGDVLRFSRPNGNVSRYSKLK